MADMVETAPRGDVSATATPAAASTGTAPEPEAPRLRDTWPMHRREWMGLGIAYVVLTALWVGIGSLITGPLDGTGLITADEDVSDWFVDQRTETLDTWTEYGSMLADTFVKAGITALVAIAMLALWRRWREPLLVVMALVLEASAFITVTMIVGRPRPDVPRLEESPVDSSFPSGHTAAAVAYAAIAIVIFWRTKNVWIRMVTVIVVVAVPVIVGTSRTYRGMHYLSDVSLGALLGAAAVFATWLVLRHGDPEESHPARRE